MLKLVLPSATALAFLAACSANSGSLGPATGSATQAGSTIVLPGPVVSGPRLVPRVPRAVPAPHGWPAVTGPILFASDTASNSVLTYNPRVVNSSPTGSITTGVGAPAGLATDKAGNLYVANQSTGTVTIYPPGSSSPSTTLTGINSPYGLAVSGKGILWVTALGTNTVMAYKPGAKSPFKTISFSSEGQAVGIATDAAGNAWVASDSTSKVYEIPVGSSTPKDAGLTGLNGCSGVSFGKNDTLYVSNFGNSNVQVYAYGTTTPSMTITQGISKYGPTLNGITGGGALFQTNQNTNIVGYKFGANTPYSTLKGDTSPLGIAATPVVVK